jgi:uncharacterized protein YbjT (DUF2867 family)
MSVRRVTIFGGSGFIGRHLVRRLAAHGDVLRIAVRDRVGAGFLKPMGDVGQIVPMAVDLADEQLVAAAVHEADLVVNLVGILYEKGRQSFRAVQAEGPGRIARAAAAAGVKRLVHLSAIGADADSPSDYARSKAAGEAAVRAAFPEAVILRPSVVFGPEDQFFNRFGAMSRFLPALPVIGAAPRLEHLPGGGARINWLGDGGPRFQPVYVGDVAAAIVHVLAHAECKGIYELGGPRIYSLAEILRLVLATVGRKRLLAPVPFWLADLQASLFELAPKPVLTCDQVRLMQRDNIVAEDAAGLSALGIEPQGAEILLPTYMGIYRPGGRLRDAALPRHLRQG